MRLRTWLLLLQVKMLSNYFSKYWLWPIGPLRINKFEWNHQNAFKTRMWNMKSSPATPTVCLEQKSENFRKSQCDIIDAVTISKIIVAEIICYVAYHSAAKFTLPIEQPSSKAAKCGIGRSWKLKLEPNLGCCSNISITISYISVFVSSWQSQYWQNYGRLSAKVTQ